MNMVNNIPVESVNMVMTHGEVDGDTLLWRNNSENVDLVRKLLNTQTKMKVLRQTNQLTGLFIVTDTTVVSHRIPHE